MFDRAGPPDRGEQKQMLDSLSAEGTHERTIDGTPAEFRVETDREHRRIQTLMYETPVLETLLGAVSADDVFYDIGANVGVYACFVGQRVDRAVAFEPHERTAARLRENIALNELDADVYEYALADSSGTTSLSHPRRSPQALGTGEFSLLDGEEMDEVGDTETIRGDTLVENRDLPRPTVAKIDVEGAELRVLDGFGETFRTCRELFIEVHRDHVAVDDVTAWLTDADFEQETLEHRGNTTFLRATTDEVVL